MEHVLLKDFTGDEITTIDEEIYVPIIENILYKNDLGIIVGKQKSNKSILSMQMTCNISTGTPFLRCFEVPTPKVVWYFGTEGKINEIKDRFVRMSQQIPTDFNNIVLFGSTQFKFNNKNAVQHLEVMLEKYKDKLPSVIFVDSLYSSYKGKLTEDDTVNNFITVIRGLMEACKDSACILAHHMRKEQTDKDGKIIPQNYSSTYGSAFLLGSCDHCFTIQKCQKNQEDRIIKCDTQRSGNIIEYIRVRFHEPEPLYLSLVANHIEQEKIITKLLSIHKNKEGLTHADLLKTSGITKSLFNMVLGEMKASRRIEKTGGRRGRYTLGGQDSGSPPLV